MSRRGTFVLQALGDFAKEGKSTLEARAEQRLARCWSLVVGPALVKHTRLLRISRRKLVIGCWDTSLMSSLRLSAEATWPQVQARLERFLKLRLAGMEILPCDPPAPIPEPKPVPEDPLLAVLQRYHALARSR